MLEALEKHMPDGIKWTRPEGGMFIWLTCPENVDTDKLFDKAIENKVAFIPGSKFYPAGIDKRNELRLNFSYPDIETIHEGVQRLARLF
jgi:2-aminoadipate transaminase